MITELSRTLYGVYEYSNTSVIFNQTPYLQVGNDLTLYFTDNDSRYATTIISISGNTAVVAFSDQQQNKRGVVVKTPHYGAGLTGPQDTWTFSFTNPPNAILQASSSGGTANVVIQVSTNNNNWINVATLAITSANANTNYTTVTNPWPYGRLNITDIAANTTITINKAI